MYFKDLTALELGRKIKNREISVLEVTNAMINYINVNDNRYNSYITLLEDDATKQARKVQERIDNGELEHSPLAGVPMAIKDNICTENVRTSCASKILENFIPSYNSTVVDKLEDAGAIMLGKLNMDEFAMGNSSETSYFGDTLNPIDPHYVPGGSSGGSAAAVAGDQAFYTLGSDTGGSIRQPSSYCGVTGIKPSYGSVSRYGLVAYASSFDQIGPIAKDISDASAVLDIIKGYDPKDSTTIDKKYQSYSNSLMDDVKGLRIAIPKELMDCPMNPMVKKHYLEAIKIFEDKGAIISYIEPTTIEFVLPVYYVLSSAEASSNLSRFDGIRYGYRSSSINNSLVNDSFVNNNSVTIEDIYIRSRSEGFGEEAKLRILFGNYLLSSDNYETYYKQALKIRRLINNEFEQIFSDFDIIFVPTNLYTAFKLNKYENDPVNKQIKVDNKYTVLANMIGGPAISIPSGLDSELLPTGLQLIGRRFGEQDIIRAAYSYECARKGD